MPAVESRVTDLDDEQLTEERTLADRLGLPRPLLWGYVGTLLFMIGDGVESGFLSSYLVHDQHLADTRVALVFSAYGIVAGLAAWFSGALSDLWGPRRVMFAGLGIWVVFQVAFLAVALPTGSYWLILVSYAVRGLGYPLFAYGFLVWIASVTPPRRMGSAVGWFWFAFTGGLPTLGSLVASVLVPEMGQYRTFWVALGLVAVGGVIAVTFVREPTGRRRLAPPGERPVATLAKSVTLMFSRPKVGVGAVVRTINTASQFGFLVFLPLYFTREVGLDLSQWLRLLSAIFVVNIFFNLAFGVVGDRIGWRRTIAVFGGIGSAVTTLLLYYVPETFGANYPLLLVAGGLYGATLAGFVPLSALMPMLAPENKGAAMSALNLGAGLSTFVGPAIVGLLLGPFGVGGVMWTFAVLYLVCAALTLMLRLPPGVSETDGSDQAEPISRLAVRAGSTLLGHPVALRTSSALDDVDLVLFDVGGTIYDDDCYAQALLKAVRELDPDADEAEFWAMYDATRQASGGSLRTSAANRLAGGDRATLAERARRHWVYPRTALYPDVLPTLTTLRESYRLGLVANSQRNVLDALRRDGVADLFDVVTLADDVGVEKPDPGIFRAALEYAEIGPSRAVYVGNRLDTDVLPAQRVGMRAVWMLRGEAPPAPTLDQLSQPDAVVTSLAGLPIALARIARRPVGRR